MFVQVKADFKHDHVALNADVDLNLAGPLINASAVVGHQGWLVGYQMAFDSAKSQVTKNNFGIGYTNKDFVIHTHVNDGQVRLLTQVRKFPSTASVSSCTC